MYKAEFLFCFGTRAMCETQCGLSTLSPKHKMLIKCWSKVGPLSGRWTSIKPALLQRLVSAGLRSIVAGLVMLTAGGFV